MSTPKAWYDILDPELFAVTARHEGDECGLIASWVMAATLSHSASRIIVALSPENHTARLIQASRRFAVHLLAQGQHELIPKLGLRSGDQDHRKLEGLMVTPSARGVPIIAGTCGWSECEVMEAVEIPERAIFVARAIEETVFPEKRPLRLARAFEELPRDVVEACKAQFLEDARRDAANA